MIPPESIIQLQDALTRARRGHALDSEIVGWLRAAAPAVADTPAPIAFDGTRGYTRSLIHRADEFEIVLLHWPPNCTTPVHDHGGSLCWLAVTSGLMGVENYVRYDSGSAPGHARIGLEGREELTIGGIDYRQDDLHLHRCITRELPASTLHIYARPLERFYAFDEAAQTCSVVTSAYDAVLQ